MKRHTSSITLAALLTVTLCAATVARADAKRVGVYVSGQGAGPVRDRIGQVLKEHGADVVKAAQMDSAVKAAKGVDSDAGAAAVAKKLRLDVVVVGEIAGGEKLTVTVRRGADGTQVGEGAWSVKGGSKKLADAVEQTIWWRIGSAFEDEPAPAAEAEAPPPAAAEAAPAAEAPVGPEPSEVVARAGEPTESEGVRARALDVSIGPRFLARSLSFTGTVTGVRSYDLSNAPALGIALDAYPSAFFARGWHSGIGVTFGAEIAPGMKSEADGLSYPTSSSDFHGGLKYRLALGSVDLTPTVGLGQQSYLIKSDPPEVQRVTLATPDVIYNYLRVGGGARLELASGLTFAAGVFYRHILSQGGASPNQLASREYFPGALLIGFEAMAALGYRITNLIEARAGLDLRRYGYNLHADRNASRYAAGALDQYIAYWLNVAILLDGV